MKQKARTQPGEYRPKLDWWGGVASEDCVVKCSIRSGTNWLLNYPFGNHGRNPQKEAILDRGRIHEQRMLLKSKMVTTPLRFFYPVGHSQTVTYFIGGIKSKYNANKKGKGIKCLCSWKTHSSIGWTVLHSFLCYFASHSLGIYSSL